MKMRWEPIGWYCDMCYLPFMNGYNSKGLDLCFDCLDYEANILETKVIVRYRCRICGRKKFTKPMAHNCKGGFLKRYVRQARLRGWDSIFEKVNI